MRVQDERGVCRFECSDECVGFCIVAIGIALVLMTYFLTDRVTGTLRYRWDLQTRSTIGTPPGTPRPSSE